MISKHLLLLFSMLFSIGSYASEVVHQLMEHHLTQLKEAQDPSGAFYPINCLNKEMTRTCYSDKSLFFTGLISESLSEFKLEDSQPVRQKSLEYLIRQFNEQKGVIHYYETSGKLYPIVKPDVDDNGIVLSLLMDHPELIDPKLIREKMQELFRHSVIDHTFKKKNSKESFTGKYFSTWVNPSDPFFNDVDLVVNFNGLLAFFKHNQKAPAAEKIDVTSICQTVNQIIDWSSEVGYGDLDSIRHWMKRKKSNYSQWYPSQYAVMLALVRAHLSGGKESCLTSSYQKIRKHLLSLQKLEGNVYDLALAGASLARILQHENLPKESLLPVIQQTHDMLETGKLGKHPFFFYGAVGYTGSLALVRTLLMEMSYIYLDQNRIPAGGQLAELEFLDSIIKEQMSDGSFTALIKPSSPLYNIFAIFMYEYLGMTEAKKDIVQKLANHILSQQKISGALAGYPEGPDHRGISIAGYTAAKIAGVSEDDQRMLQLERSIKAQKHKRSDMLTIPFMMMFSLFPLHSTLHTELDSFMLKFSENMPWVKVLIHPVLYMLDNGHNRLLPPEKYPSRIMDRSYEKYARKTKSIPKRTDPVFLKWALEKMNPDGTFFDYTPTTIPMLMALSTFEDQKPLVEKGVNTIETFQEVSGEGSLLQTPGEASIGETFYIANVLLDVGLDHANPTVKRAEKYLLDHQLASGGWGFSKNSVHFADSDDTSNAMYFLIRLDQARGKKIRSEVFTALKWLLTLQNKDGGFGTWEATRGGLIGNLINHVANRRGLVMSESVFEHTARIVVCLSYLKDHSPGAAKSYEKAYRWLQRQQKGNGSFAGTWFINYMFSTSMAMTALSTDPIKGDKAIRKAIDYLKETQGRDGGFGESPDSFLKGKAVMLKQSSWAQTGLVVSQLHTMNQLTQCKYHGELKELLQTTHLYLRDEKDGWTQQMDPTWTAVTFPKVEYLIYPYIQRMVPWQAYNMHLTSNCF